MSVRSLLYSGIGLLLAACHQDVPELVCAKPPVRSAPAAGSFGSAHGTDSTVYSLIVSDDGSLYVGGGFTRFESMRAPGIAHVGETGAPDPKFRRGIVAGVRQLAPVADGSVYLVGDGGFYGVPGPAITKIRCDGTPDPEFSAGNGFGSDSGVYAVTTAKDGSGAIYVGGNFRAYQGQSSPDIVRLKRDGTIDHRFHVGTGFDFEVNTILVMNDGSGRVYVGGLFGTYDGQSADSIARLWPDGTLDTTFVTGSGFDGLVNVITPVPGGAGAIYVGGQFTSYNGIAASGIVRLNADGSVDTGFVTGTGFPQHGCCGNGEVATIVSAPDGSGDIYVGGAFDSYNGTASPTLIRLHADGSVNATLQVGTGFVRGNGPAFPDLVETIALAKDGSGDIYVGGNFISYNGVGINNLARLHPDGALDATFDTFSRFNADRLSSLLPLSDGKLYVGGLYSYYGATPANGILRLNDDGTVDAGFDDGTGFSSDAAIGVIASAPDGTGDIYVPGAFSTYRGLSCAGIVRLHADGSRQSTFDVGSGFDSASSAIVLPVSDGTNDIYVAGEFASYRGVSSPRIIRLHDDGSVATGFNAGSGFDGTVLQMESAADGSGDVYVAGLFTSYNGSSSSYLIRLHDDGSIATSFSMGSGFEADPLFGLGQISIAVASDGSGDLYATGMFVGYDGSAANRIVRIKADGTIDAHFDSGSGFDDGTNAILATNDGTGDIYVGGQFTTYRGVYRPFLIRLTSHGDVVSSFVSAGFQYFGPSQLARAADSSGDIFFLGGGADYGDRVVDNIARVARNGKPR